MKFGKKQQKARPTNVQTFKKSVYSVKKFVMKAIMYCILNWEYSGGSNTKRVWILDVQKLMEPTIQKQNKMVAILSKTIRKPDKNFQIKNGLVLEWSGP